MVHGTYTCTWYMVNPVMTSLLPQISIWIEWFNICAINITYHAHAPLASPAHLRLHYYSLASCQLSCSLVVAGMKIVLLLALASGCWCFSSGPPINTASRRAAVCEQLWPQGHGSIAGELGIISSSSMLNADVSSSRSTARRWRVSHPH